MSNTPFDGNYHCAYCDKIFRIANQAEFLEHQRTCDKKPAVQQEPQCHSKFYPLCKADTGSFQELAHASDIQFGQLSLLTIAPRCKRGGHYHTRKKEWFCCIRGECELIASEVKGDQIKGALLSSEHKEFVPVYPYEVHTVLNPYDRECELLVISSEEYDPDDPDTFMLLKPEVVTTEGGQN